MAGDPHECPINLAYLADVSGNDGDFQRDLVATFVQSSANVMERLRDAVRVGDREDVFQAVHSLKGACQAIGAQSLGAACEKLEGQVRAGVLTAPSESVAGIEQHLADLCVFIRRRWPS